MHASRRGLTGAKDLDGPPCASVQFRVVLFVLLYGIVAFVLYYVVTTALQFRPSSPATAHPS
jgi:hypothetical protein